MVLHGVKYNTRRTYGFAEKLYLLFCDMYGFNVMPASESQILAFVAHLNRRGLCSSTMSVYLAAVRFLHVSNGFIDPLWDRPHIKLVLRAVGLEGSGPQQKLPITHEILAAIKAFSLSMYDDYTCWTAMN